MTGPAASPMLSALETGFLHAESPRTPMHVGSLATYDGAGWRDSHGDLRMEALREHINARLAIVPRLRQRVVWPPGRAGRARWSDDPRFDIRHHVRRTRLPHPGNDRALLAITSKLHMQLLDPDRPLWELWFVDGLTDGRVGVVEKIHHAMVDGIGGVDVGMLLLDPAPLPSTEGTPEYRPEPTPRPLRLLADTILRQAEEPIEVGRELWHWVAHPAGTVEEATELVAAWRSVKDDLAAPRSSLNAPVGETRRYEVVRFSLDEARAIGRALGGTINDVVLTAVASGLRHLLETRHEVIDSQVVNVLVPVSLRTDAEHESLGNRVTGMIVPLPIGDVEPQARFALVAGAVRSRKAAHQPDLLGSLLAIPEHWPEPMIAAFSQLIHRQPMVNLVVTNVPGPPMPLYLMGARLLELFPVVPLGGNLTVSVGVLSYNGQLTIGLFADRRRFGDLHVFAGAIEAAFAELAARTHRAAVAR